MGILPSIRAERHVLGKDRHIRIVLVFMSEPVQLIVGKR